MWPKLLHHFCVVSVAGSLLLFAAICILWPRSHYVSDNLTWCNASGWREVYTYRGHLVINLLPGDYSASPQQFQKPKFDREDILQRSLPDLDPRKQLGGEPDDTHSTWQRAGFAWQELRNARLGTRQMAAVLPLWSLTLITAILPSLWTIRRLRHQRCSTPGLCPTCGYDVRVQLGMSDRSEANDSASPQRCPECGTPTPRGQSNSM